nr:MAG TPA: hypothetical protein [Caudoviricetes sp.]
MAASPRLAALWPPFPAIPSLVPKNKYQFKKQKEK